MLLFKVAKNLSPGIGAEEAFCVLYISGAFDRTKLTVCPLRVTEIEGGNFRT